jgi:hypothetical protein
MTHRNADTRIREAFQALRSEMVSLFGEPPELPSAKEAGFDNPKVLHHMAHYYIDQAEEDFAEYAKLPASA